MKKQLCKCVNYSELCYLLMFLLLCFLTSYQAICKQHREKITKKSTNSSIKSSYIVDNLKNTSKYVFL